MTLVNICKKEESVNHLELLLLKIVVMPKNVQLNKQRIRNKILVQNTSKIVQILCNLPK